MSEPTTKKVKQTKYYDPAEIEKAGAAVNVVMGRRSKGKTYTMLYKILSNYWKAKQNGKLEQGIYIRRRKENLAPAFMSTVCDTLKSNGFGVNVIKEITDGAFDEVYYYRGEWRLCKKDDKTGLVKKDVEAFMISAALSVAYNSKGAAYPFVTTIWLEEFMAAPGEAYLPNEWAIFQQLLSTITRDRTDVILWLMGNSIDLLCPYFENLGLNHITQQKPGTIEIYKLGHTSRKIAVEFTSDTEDYKKSKTESKYLFAFDTEDSRLITDGTWQLGEYPIQAEEVNVKDICGRFIIEYKDKYFVGDIVCQHNIAYIYIHAFDDPLHPVDKENDLIYSRAYNTAANYRRDLMQPFTEGERVIKQLFSMQKVFYDCPLTGFYISSFLKEARLG